MSEKSQILGDSEEKKLTTIQKSTSCQRDDVFRTCVWDGEINKSFPPSSSHYGALCYHQVRSHQHLQGGQSVYTEAGEDIEAIPPTTDALLRHTKRSKY